MKESLLLPACILGPVLNSLTWVWLGFHVKQLCSSSQLRYLQRISEMSLQRQMVSVSSVLDVKELDFSRAVNFGTWISLLQVMIPAGSVKGRYCFCTLCCYSYGRSWRLWALVCASFITLLVEYHWNHFMVYQSTSESYLVTLDLLSGGPSICWSFIKVISWESHQIALLAHSIGVYLRFNLSSTLLFPRSSLNIARYSGNFDFNTLQVTSSEKSVLTSLVCVAGLAWCLL